MFYSENTDNDRWYIKKKGNKSGYYWDIHINKFIMVDYQETACKIMSRLMDWNISSIL